MTDRYRPVYHFTPPSDWMNDPNGLVYFEGECHLFYQFRTPRSWGHAVSSDLMNWEHLAVALEPDALGDVWSGSAVVDWKNSSGFFPDGPGLVAAYTSHTDERQVQCLAYSRNRGRTWTKYAGNPVLADESFRDFRDPKIFWHEPSGRWVMILATGDCASLYGSDDLKAWTLLSRFGNEAGMSGLVWECCDLFELAVEGEAGESRWVLLVSLIDPAMFQTGKGLCRTRYFVGSFDGERFTPDDLSETLWLSHGHDDYAAVSFAEAPGPAGMTTVIGWMNNWLYGSKTPTEPWQGMMTLPRALWLRRSEAGPRLYQRPVEGIEGLRRKGESRRDVAVTAERALSVAVDGNAYEVRIEIAIGGASEVSLHVAKSGEQETVIWYDAARSELSIDRTRSGKTEFHPAFANVQKAALEPVDGRLNLRVFVDRCSMEVFANGGTVYAASLIFPEREGDCIEVRAAGGTATIERLDVGLIALPRG